MYRSATVLILSFFRFRNLQVDRTVFADDLFNLFSFQQPGAFTLYPLPLLYRTLIGDGGQADTKGKSVSASRKHIFFFTETSPRSMDLQLFLLYHTAFYMSIRVSASKAKNCHPWHTRYRASGVTFFILYFDGLRLFTDNTATACQVFFLYINLEENFSAGRIHLGWKKSLMMAPANSAIMDAPSNSPGINASNQTDNACNLFEAQIGIEIQ